MYLLHWKAEIEPEILVLKASSFGKPLLVVLVCVIYCTQGEDEVLRWEHCLDPLHLL